MDSAGSPSIFEDSAGSLSIFEDSAGVGAQCPTCARLCTRCVLLQQTCPTYSSMLTQWLERLIAILQDNRRLYATWKLTAIMHCALCTNNLRDPAAI